MPILTQPTSGPRTALVYITLGALIDVWTLVWYFTRERALTGSEQFWVVGLVLTGLTLIVLGLLLGQIGRAARRAEMPPPEVAKAEADIQKIAAANQPAVAAAPAAPVAPVVASTPVVAAPAQPAAPQGVVVPQQPVVRVG
jgi:hypothetical protein